MDTTPQSESPPLADILVRDVILWRRKKLSVVVLCVATGMWVVLEVYQLNILTVASWLAMLLVFAAFLWGNILRLSNKEPPEFLSGMEIRKQSAVEATQL